MLSHWLPTWYTTQPQSQEPFNDQYEATEGEWVQVLKPTTKQQQETNEPSPSSTITKDEPKPVTETKQEDKSVMKPEPVKEQEKVTTTTQEEEKLVSKPEETAPSTEKPLSRQEKRAMARMAVREKKKQARNSAMLLSRRGKSISTNCLPTNPLVIE